MSKNRYQTATHGYLTFSSREIQIPILRNIIIDGKGGVGFTSTTAFCSPFQIVRGSAVFFLILRSSILLPQIAAQGGDHRPGRDDFPSVSGEGKFHPAADGSVIILRLLQEFE